MGRSVMFQLIRGNARAQSGSGFRRKRIQAAIGLIRDSGVREFLLDLLVDAGGFLWIRTAKDSGEFQQHKWARNEDAGLVRQSAKDFDCIIGFAGARVNDRHLILRHGGQLFVTAAADLLQFFECLIVALEVLETKRGVVAREFSGIRAGILVGNLGELLQSILEARGIIGIDGLIGVGGVRSCTDPALVSLHGGIEGGIAFHGLAIDVKPPAAVGKRGHQSNKDDDERELSVRDNGFSAVLDGFLDFVLLQFFARNMIGHKRSPDWYGICNRNTIFRSLAGLEDRLWARGRGFTFAPEKCPASSRAIRMVLILEDADGVHSLWRGALAERWAVRRPFESAVQMLELW